MISHSKENLVEFTHPGDVIIFTTPIDKQKYYYIFIGVDLFSFGFSCLCYMLREEKD